MQVGAGQATKVLQYAWSPGEALCKPRDWTNQTIFIYKICENMVE